MVINPIVTDERGRSNDIFSKNLENRVIHLVGEVTDEMSASITAQLLHLAAVSDEDIQLYQLPGRIRVGRSCNLRYHAVYQA